MLKSSLCDYSDAYILVKGTITITGEGDDAAEGYVDEWNKGVIFENWTPFTGCISEINNTQVDNAKDLHVVMSMYNLLENSDTYSKKNKLIFNWSKFSRRKETFCIIIWK